MLSLDQRENGTQILKLFVTNLPGQPDCVMFQFYGEGVDPLHSLGIELKLFGLGPSRQSGRSGSYERMSMWMLDGAPLIKQVFVDFLTQVSNSADSTKPIWIALDRPKGDLPLVPWERLIAPYVASSLMRWPYHAAYAKTRQDGDDSLEIALCASVPRAKAPFEPHEPIVRYVEGVLEHNPRHRFHIFVDFDVDSERQRDQAADGPFVGDVGTFDRIAAELADRIDQDTVVLYDPRDADNYGVAPRVKGIPEPSDGLVNPWLVWIRDALAVPSVDLVHFFCHGYLSRGRGSLAFAESPLLNRDSAWARFVGAVELTGFLDQVGAWSVGFSSPYRNYCEAALWSLADEIGAARPGPVLVHDLAADSGDALVQSFRFVFDGDRDAMQSTGAITLYGHPHLLEERSDSILDAAENVVRRGVDVSLEGVGQMLDKFGVEVPDQLLERDGRAQRWVTASRRILERKASNLFDEQAEELLRKGFESLSETSASAGKQRALSFVVKLLQEKMRDRDG